MWVPQSAALPGHDDATPGIHLHHNDHTDAAYPLFQAQVKIRLNASNRLLITFLIAL